MTDIIVKKLECQSCGSQYNITYDPDEVHLDYPTEHPLICPFCGEEVVDEDDPSFGLDMTDQAEFGKGVDHMDGDDEY